MTDDDRYRRTQEATPLAAALADLDGFDPQTLGYTPEWWERRDREVAEARAKKAADDERARMTKRAGELLDNGFPELFVTAALGELDITPAMQHARTFPYLPQKLLLLGGGVGVGKTTAATWISLRCEDLRPGFIRANELERRGRYDRGFSDWLADKTSLVIDDIGAEYLDGKGAFRSLMDEIIDTFYANRRRLVMTTNLRPRITDEDRAAAKRDGREPEPQFFERYGERAWSRLTQSGLWVSCGTRDLRKERA